MPPWNAPRAKVQLKLSIQRLQLLQDKKTALTKQTRRDIADLLSKSKLETARVRCEVVIGDEITVELLELLALYSELLLARFALIENSPATEPDEGIKEAVCSLIFAAPRTEVRELQILRDILVHRFSRDFALSAIENRDSCVNERVAKKLAIFRPPSTLIDAYLDEIARTYGVKWRATVVVEGDVPGVLDASGENGETAGEGREKKDDVSSTTSTAATPASSSSSAPAVPPPSYDTPPSASEKPAAAPPAVPPPTELDALSARFAALKKSSQTTTLLLSRPPLPFSASNSASSSIARFLSSWWVKGMVVLVFGAGGMLVGVGGRGWCEGFVDGWREGWVSE